ncbi:MAG: mechanosensitive ion channel family protein [Bacteroidales bacterium]|nr:mechanosensitive ion channel family protein [Bacteroidales bacterium]
MLIHLLQTEVAEKFSADTLVAKGSQLVETIRTTPANELLQGTASAALRFGLKVLVALLIYVVGAWLIRKTKKIIANGFAKKQSDSTLSSFIQSMVSALLWIVLILAMVGTLGINITSFAALLAAGGMAVGMAMSGTVQNFAGGLMLLAFKPFKVGDYVEVQGYFGWISEITIVHTKLITTDNREITIPNGALSNGNIDNYSSRDPRRIDMKIHLPYGSDVEQVRAELLRIASQHEKILDRNTPGAWDPYVVVNSLNDSNVEFKLRVWATGADFMTVIYWLNETIYTELPKHGINFAFPQLDVHMKPES